MTFDVDSIKFRLGEQEVSVQDLCARNARDYSRLIGKSGFQKVFRTSLPEGEFFSNFLRQELYIQKNDCVILVNQGISSVIPGKVPQLFQGIPNIESVFFVELSDGCTGFVRALTMANSFLISKSFLRVHIICAEKYSAFFDESDNSVSPIFSDAISLTTLVLGTKYSILASAIDNCFAKSDLISTQEDSTGRLKLRMDGGPVLSWAIDTVPSNIRVLLEKSRLTMSDIDSWYFHQGSKVMLEMLAEKLDLDKFGLFSSESIGNTTSSSIPIALSKSFGSNKNIQLQGNNFVLVGFGVGLSVVSVIIAANK